MLLPLALAACSDGGEERKTHSIGGSIIGLTGTGLVLATSGQPDLAILPGQTAFTFANRVGRGTAYAVTVSSQPAAPVQSCAVANSVGTVGNADVTAVDVSCEDTLKWSVTGAMSTPRAYFALEGLSSGKVLAAGGQILGAPFGYSAKAELYDPATGTWSPAADLELARGISCSVRLPSGKVFIVGGYQTYAAGIYTSSASAEVYDPVADRWDLTPESMSVARGEPSCVLLDSGVVLVAGGVNGDFTAITATAELYDPTTGGFAPTGPMATARYAATATKLADGRVLVVGGCTSISPYCNTATASAEIYDPSTGLWSSTPSLGAPVTTNSATLLPSGEVLIAGGCLAYAGPGMCADQPSDRRSAVYDPTPTPGAWTATESLVRGHSDQMALLLEGGQVLLVGGGYFSGFSTWTEYFDPSAGTWRAGPTSLVNHGNGARAVKLLDGSWLVVGGSHTPAPGVYVADAELLEEIVPP